MSMIPGIDDDRWAGGMSTERFHPWHERTLDDSTVSGVEGMAGAVAIVSLLGPEGGCHYEQAEPYMNDWRRVKSTYPYGERPS